MRWRFWGAWYGWKNRRRTRKMMRAGEYSTGCGLLLFAPDRPWTLKEMKYLYRMRWKSRKEIGC